jgi:dTDP-4-dehydrorhamnose reductase
MNKILVTGSKGMLGRDLCPALEDCGFETIETDIDNLDITDENKVKDIFEKEDFDAVIHCAAYTDINKAESEQEFAMKVNVNGTENLAIACKNKDIPLLYISSDYVFDGNKKGAYLPYDDKNPINVYGRSKSKGEDIVEKHCQKYYIVRTSLLYGLFGENFVEKIISLAENSSNTELKVSKEQIVCPTWTQELSNGIITLLKEEVPYGKYHVCATGKTTLFDFAKEIISLLNIKANIVPVEDGENDVIVKKPKNGELYNDNICRTWKSALKDYLQLRG